VRQELRCKGNNFKGALAAVERLEGERTVARVLEACPPALGARLRTIGSGGWYPIADYRELHKAINVVLPRPGVSRAVAREATRHDFRGVYRMFMAVFKPETVMKHVMRLWGLYFDGGKVTITPLAPGTIEVLWSDCVGFDHNVFEDAIGGSEAVLEAAGARDLGSEILAGGGNGDSRALVKMHWR
jgi:hypothetical protein